ncbi:hypothetical protein GTO27_13410, partial [Candidatus Bathyarchaeota archaeon]|nr:hypothetical protein [Candidatus Bathyarchaeota archaeon]
MVVKDEIIIHGLEKAARKKPQIIPNERILQTERVRILDKLMERKLAEAERKVLAKYASGIEAPKIVESVDAYASILGIEVSAVPTVRDFYNPTRLVTPKDELKIWKSKGRQIVAFILGDRPPLGKSYNRYIEPQDVINAASFIEAGLATHILYVLYRAGTYSRNYRRAG